MAASEQYKRQVALLVQILPFIAEEDYFALKGGTAINLFVRDLPPRAWPGCGSDRGRQPKRGSCWRRCMGGSPRALTRRT